MIDEEKVEELYLGCRTRAEINAISIELTGKPANWDKVDNSKLILRGIKCQKS